MNRSEDSRQFTNLVKSAIRFGKVPEGKLLTVEHGRRWEDLVIRLSDPPAWQTAALQPVSVPKTTRAMHRHLVSLHDDPRISGISRQSRGRALRLLQGLLAEADRRGYGAVAGDRLPHSGRWADRPWFGINVNGHTIGVALRQIIDRVPHEPTDAELRKKERDSWHRIPTHDDVPTDRLMIVVTNGHEYRQSRWSDGKTARLEDSLAQVLQEIELRAQFEEERRQAELQRQAEQRRRWEEQVERAKEELQEHHRAEVLLKRAQRWERNVLMRRYLDAIARRADELSDEQARADAVEWLTWCREYLDQTDPLKAKIQRPNQIEPTPDRLAPFMRGLSPYGPGP